MAYGPFSNTTWIALAAVGTFAYGVEHWRSHTARRAVTEERANLHRLAVCVLGPDGERLIVRPADTRRRLRALAMTTSLRPEPTWLYRCVPLARATAVRGSVLDVTRTVGSVATHVGDRARELSRELARVDLVWRVRAGDPDADMDRLAELLNRTADEIGLADVRDVPSIPVRSSDAVAPTPWVQPDVDRLGISGLVPLPVGSPQRFMVGAPLPLVSSVAITEHGLTIEGVVNLDAGFWRLAPQGLVGIVAERNPTDGLAEVFLQGPTGRLGAGRVAAPPPGTPSSAVSLDAASAHGTLWLVEAVRAQPPTLCRLAPGVSATAARLSPSSADGGAGQVRVDDEVAVGSDGATVVAAYTHHTPGALTVDVSVVRATGGERASVEAVTDGTWRVPGHRPHLAFCHAGASMWLFAAGRRGWRAGIVRGRSLLSAAPMDAPTGEPWDESVTVRCSGDRAVAYGRDRPRTTPLLVCNATPAGPVCASHAAPQSPQPGDMAMYTSGGVHGEPTVHPEWPFAAAVMSDGAVIAARASGTIVAAARLDPGATAWRRERVVFDAAADQHGVRVTGVELYADGGRVLLVTSTSDQLFAAASDDGGGAWERP